MKDNRLTLSVRKRIQIDGNNFPACVYTVATDSRFSQIFLNNQYGLSNEIDNTSLSMEPVFSKRKGRVLSLARVDSFNGSSFTLIHVQ